MLILKPDAFERMLIGEILKIYEPNIIEMHTDVFDERDCEIHYKEEVGKPHYDALVRHMKSSPSLFVLVDMHWGIARLLAIGVRDRWRSLSGPKNLIHSSDSEISDARETAYWFGGRK